MLDDDHDIGAVLPQLGGERLHTRRADEHRVHLAAARGVGERARGGDGLERHAAQRAASLFRECEDVRHHSTFASSRSSRISSGTAAGPSPMMRPAFRSGGSSILVTVRCTGPSCAGFTSSGFFFAAMIPLSAG